MSYSYNNPMSKKIDAKFKSMPVSARFCKLTADAYSSDDMYGIVYATAARCALHNFSRRSW